MHCSSVHVVQHFVLIEQEIAFISIITDLDDLLGNFTVKSLSIRSLMVTTTHPLILF